MNPLILYDSRLMDGTPTATDTDTASGYDILNIRDLRPYTWWQAASSGTKYIAVDCGSAKSADALGVIGHNLKAANATVSVESSPDNAVWTERLAGFTPASDRAFLKTFNSASARYWRVKIVTASVAPRLAVCLLGNKLEFPYPPDAPYNHYDEGIEAESKKSKTGYPLGAVVSYKDIKLSLKIGFPERAFFTGAFRTFWDSHASALKPFLFAFDLTTFPEDVYLVQVPDGQRFVMPLSVGTYADSLSIEMEGYKEP